MPVPTIQEQFGQIDIYLFDQLLKGRISPGMRILDAGCGSGRNLVYFLREGYEVYAVDPDVQAVESVRALARMFAPVLPESNFSVEAVERMFCARRRALRVHGARSVARPEARRALLLPPRILDRHGESDKAHRGTPLQIARWFGAISRG